MLETIRNEDRPIVVYSVLISFLCRLEKDVLLRGQLNIAPNLQSVPQETVLNLLPGLTITS